MASDPEKRDLEAQHLPQDIDGPIEHPGVSTTRDDESKRESTGEESIRSHISDDTIENAPIPVEDQPAQSSKSRSSSLHSHELIIVPLSKRRGLLARFALIPEVERPYDYKRSTKWTITLLVAAAGAAAPMGSAIFFRECPFLEIFCLPLTVYILMFYHHSCPS